MTKMPKNNVEQKTNAPSRSGKESLAIFLRLAGYVKRHGFLFLVAVGFTLLSNQLALLGPLYSGEAIDAMVTETGVNFPLVWENVAKMLLCYVLSAVLSYLLSVIMVRLSQKIVYTMRKQLFEKLNTLPVSYFDSHPVGDIVSRISYDIDTVNGSLSHDLVQVMTSIYTVMGSLVFMFQISKPLLIVVAFTVPISVLFTRYRTRKVRPMFRARSAKLG
ncbi:MAG: ABC transporter ATP-binding protein, partial [Clostridia bacterium]|nr:ABC transporter ATP-binding protein [Clostridia bacterium]